MPNDIETSPADRGDPLTDLPVGCPLPLGRRPHVGQPGVDHADPAVDFDRDGVVDHGEVGRLRFSEQRLDEPRHPPRLLGTDAGIGSDRVGDGRPVGFEPGFLSFQIGQRVRFIIELVE